MKVAICARVSTEGQEKQETINSQLAELRNYASHNNMDVVEEYIDNGYSGGKVNRLAVAAVDEEAWHWLTSPLESLSASNINLTAARSKCRECKTALLTGTPFRSKKSFS